MPYEFDRLPEDGADGVVRVVVTIRTGKNHHAEFHGNSILAHCEPQAASGRADIDLILSVQKQTGRRVRCDKRYRRRGFAWARDFDFTRPGCFRPDVLRLEDFIAFFGAASSRRRAFAQPSLLTCRPRASASASGGTFSVMTEPAAT